MAAPALPVREPVGLFWAGETPHGLDNDTRYGVTDMKIAPHWHHDTRMTTDLRRALVPAARPNPLVAAWRWRYEIALLAGLAAGITLAVISIGLLPTIGSLIVITLTLLCWPPARQFVLDHAWRIITAHRVRVGCAEAMIYSSRGKIPFVLWTAHQPYGERVLLMCRAGTCVDDFITNRPILISACWAQDIIVVPDERHPHLVTLDVIRRPPSNLTGSRERLRVTDPPDGPYAWPDDEDQ